ncbi:TldD/PmbA family protein [Sphingomonas sp.]|uniref:TldD/PmbA family protein n=1 Tax=Sphingomonas sp. TaxID=28214 RepID=UPI0025CCCFE9|nr:TldD/PmbA family protein [Sphingomonas sp.]
MTETIIEAQPATDADFLHDVAARALKAGASDVQVDGRASRSLSVDVRDGSFQDIRHDEIAAINVTTYVGKRRATLGTNKFARADIDQLIDRVIAMTRLAPENPFYGLAGRDEIVGPGNDAFLALYDPYEPTPEMLEDWAGQVEEAARAIQGVVSTDSAGASWEAATGRTINTAGLDRRSDGTRFGVGVGVMAARGDAREVAGAGRGARWHSDLPACAAIGTEAGMDAAAKLGARKIASGNHPVIFDRRIAMCLIEPMLGAITGENIARGTSFLKDRLGDQVFAKGITLTDDAFVVRGQASRACDAEGIPPQRRALVDRGVLTGWMTDLAAARELGLASTGHAGGPTNLTILPGDTDQAGLMRAAGRGLLVDALFGPSLNPHTGDWSVGVSGQWFEQGEIAYPVSEVTVAGNLLDLYAGLVAGSDLEFRGAANAPSLLVPQMAIGGQ